ncbi:MAG: amidohydrolase family protein [Clostridiales bacterium]|jgi:predicted TIM-barrel fold metal-dependent hydrolase|nr:amidohydrolase family protein [Clostridiales bacterium]
MIIDCHAHAFPEKIRQRAMASLTTRSGEVTPFCDGSIEGFMRHINDGVVDCAVLLNIATNPGQQKNVNDFAIEMNETPGVIAFGSVHPYAADALSELARLKAAGIKGIKLHPDYQGFFVDDPAVFPIYEKAAELGLITVFHSGVDIGVFEPIRCAPKALAAVLPVFQGAPVVAAHFGGFEMWYEVEKYLVGKDIYFDTAYCSSRMAPLHAKRIMENHAPDKLVFGSDSPWSGVANEINFVKSFAPQERLADIFGRNAEKLLRL